MTLLPCTSPVPTGREPRGGGGRREAGHGPRTHGGKGTAGVRRRRVGGRAGRAPGNTAAEGGTANDGGPEDATPPHPPPPRAPAAWRETVPSPRHPRGSDTRRPLAARGSSQRGETDPGGPGRPGASAGALVPFSPLAGDVPPGHRGGGGGDAVSALRGTEGPEALRGQPPATRPPGRRAQDTRTPEGRLIVKRRSDRRSPGRNPGPQVRSKCR